MTIVSFNPNLLIPLVPRIPRMVLKIIGMITARTTRDPLETALIKPLMLTPDSDRTKAPRRTRFRSVNTNSMGTNHTIGMTPEPIFSIDHSGYRLLPSRRISRIRISKIKTK
ncbi:uncharacterized protein LDX57_010784 [Aspergillus melleus]|uniref:uncharacterized protein n=1 Tax=Aspergillus melleus TaxID=138277 RepID=UPI001E8E6E93|nr:uncharacterized protein LDX57_010784 [Aspergillus melleus]KAH8433150.1 hypothetical protein LDX57_010784 [Aspergillus melleus]